MDFYKHRLFFYLVFIVFLQIEGVCPSITLDAVSPNQPPTIREPGPGSPTWCRYHWWLLSHGPGTQGCLELDGASKAPWAAPSLCPAFPVPRSIWSVGCSPPHPWGPLLGPTAGPLRAEAAPSVAVPAMRHHCEDQIPVQV